MVLHGKAEVVAGRASSGGQAGGNADGPGSAALFGTMSGIVTDGKRFAYVADTSNNTIRRLDISALFTH